MQNTVSTPFIPLARPDIRPEDWARVQSVLESGLLVQGKNVQAFEEALTDFTGLPHAALVSSGTAALHLALMALDIGSDDAVICPAFTFPATANVVERVGARTVLCDVGASNYVMRPEGLQATIANYQGVDILRAVIVVHEFGFPADVSAIRAICDAHNLLLIEDSACALGTRTEDDLHVGHHAHASCFSFHPRKAITTGEGGAIISADGDLIDRVRLLRNHGIVTGVQQMPANMDFAEAGLNYRLTDFQAAMAIGQLERFPDELEKRRALATRYKQQLGETPRIALPDLPTGHALQSFMVVLDQSIDRPRIIQALLKEGIQTNLGAQALHCLAYYQERYGHQPEDFPVAAKLFRQGLVLPLYGSLTENEVHWILERVKAQVAACA